MAAAPRSQDKRLRSHPRRGARTWLSQGLKKHRSRQETMQMGGRKNSEVSKTSEVWSPGLPRSTQSGHGEDNGIKLLVVPELGEVEPDRRGLMEPADLHPLDEVAKTPVDGGGGIRPSPEQHLDRQGRLLD